MAQVSIIAIILAVLSAATARAQNYPPFLHEAEQVLVNEFQKLGDLDWGNGVLNKSGVYDRLTTTTMPSARAIKTTRLPSTALGHTA
jgi:hypothetical protein